MTRRREKPWYAAVADLVSCGCSLRQAVDVVAVEREGLEPGTWGRMRGVSASAVENSMREVARDLEAPPEDHVGPVQTTLDQEVLDRLENLEPSRGGLAPDGGE